MQAQRLQQLQQGQWPGASFVTGGGAPPTYLSQQERSAAAASGQGAAPGAWAGMQPRLLSSALQTSGATPARPQAAGPAQSSIAAGGSRCEVIMRSH